MADTKIVMANTSFTVQHNGVPVFVAEDDLWDAGDPIVKGREHLFGEPNVRSTAGLGAPGRRRGQTETADAAPGSPRRAVPAPAPEAAPAKTKSTKQDPPPSEV